MLSRTCIDQALGIVESGTNDSATAKHTATVHHQATTHAGTLQKHLQFNHYLVAEGAHIHDCLNSAECF